MNNSIYIRRKNKLYIDKEDNSLTEDYLLNLLKNIEGLGYTFSVELIEVVKTLSVDRLKTFYKQLISDLKENVGAFVEFKPMYPNFPDQVKEASEEELYSNAFFHYLGDWIGKRILPNYEKKQREQLKDQVNLKVIGLGNKEDFTSIFTKLISSKTSISETDKKDIEWFVKTYNENVKKLLPDTIPLKENIAYLLGCYTLSNIEADELFGKYVKTATDVLRIATAISEGDISLADNTKYKTISKKNRRTLLLALENAGSITEDMLRYKNRWKRLGEKLHPFDYKKRFPKCFEAFDIIRNDKPFQTFNGKVEKSIIDRDTITATNLLKSRPGELARRLDKLIRMSSNTNNIVSSFREIATKTSTPVLLQVHCHFKNRNLDKELRTFFPKGNVGKARAIDNKLPNINIEICNEIVSVCELALVESFKKYKPLGKVYLDEKLKDYTIPFALRSASKAFTNQPYCDLPICFAGFMIRQFPNSGEIYEPLAVQNKFDLTANTRIAIPIIIDLYERKIIWTDLSLKGDPSTNNNVHNNLSSVTIINKSMTTLTKPNLFDLFNLHIAARGERTFDIKEANTIFAVENGIKPSDIDILISEYL